MYIISSVEDLQELNSFIVIGCGGGGEKFANFEGVNTAGFVDDDPKKQSRKFCDKFISSDLNKVIDETDARSVAIMLPIGAEGAALKYAVEAIKNGLNVVTSFRSLPLIENKSLIKLAESKGVIIKEISPRMDIIDGIFGISPSKCTEILPKINYKAKAPVVYIGGTSQECGKRTTTRFLGKTAIEEGLKAVVISTDELGLEKPVDINFRAGSLSVMDVASAIMGTVKYIEEKDDPDIIFVESQASLTEMDNPHPRGLSAAILISCMPAASIVCHRPNHPYRKPRGINYEINAIEALEPTKVVGISLNLRNVDNKKDIFKYEKKYGLPTVDIMNGGASRLLKAIMDHLGGYKKWKMF